MKRLSAWMAAAPFRHVRIWWHDRYGIEGCDKSEIWWHVELHEHCLEPGGMEHKVRLQAGKWTKHETVWTGYDTDLNKATTKAMRLAKERQ